MQIFTTIILLEMKATSDTVNKYAVACTDTGAIWYFESKAEAKHYAGRSQNRKYIGKTI